MRPKVYLAGPIAGLTYGDAQEWRTYAASVLDGAYIDGFSPLRAKNFLDKFDAIGTNKWQHPLATDRGIMTRDHWDCKTSDLILANFEGTVTPSRGTDMEMAWAYAYDKPLVVAVREDSPIYAHPMVREAIDYRVDTLDEALAIVKAILRPSAR